MKVMARNLRDLLHYHHTMKGIRLFMICLIQVTGVLYNKIQVTGVHKAMSLVRGELEEELDFEIPGFIGGSTKQRGEFRDEGDSMYEPSLPDEEDIDGEKHEVEGGSQQIPFPDCEPPQSTYLLFARALPTNGTSSVKKTLQDLVLYLEAHGLPVYRLHGDKGETFNHSIRNWARERGIRSTWSEPGVPQGNGQAESTVKWVKDNAKALLFGASLQAKLWPTAVEAATALQRARVLNWKQSLIAPYGSIVYVKKKAFDSSGPRRREQAFESRWETRSIRGFEYHIRSRTCDLH